MVAVEEAYLLEELRRLTESLGIEIRRTQGEFVGGICSLNGKRVFFLNEALPRGKMVELFCHELARQDLSRIFVLPAVRMRLDRYAPVP